ncbi:MULTISPECIES: flagellar biosynthetic protein FliO [unclassified Oceanicaulis]|uniref:flagellar biosynthetic protein FliO n=1 Tax=unclassified Oceanicaulis TaxID=2632123 RepID=UPI000323D12E|nr:MULTISPECIES: flagellar biosynthetic protein FliO [unclassified Oceanicaulis]
MSGPREQDEATLDQLDIIRYFAALILVLGLLGGFAVLARRAGWTGALPALDRWSPQARKRRLSVTETLILDPRRKVVIVRVDDTEHVLLLGGEREQVLERGPAPAEPVFEPVAPDHDEAEDDDTQIASVTRLGGGQ